MKGQGDVYCGKNDYMTCFVFWIGFCLHGTFSEFIDTETHPMFQKHIKCILSSSIDCFFSLSRSHIKCAGRVMKKDNIRPALWEILHCARARSPIPLHPLELPSSLARADSSYSQKKSLDVIRCTFSTFAFLTKPVSFFLCLSQSRSAYISYSIHPHHSISPSLLRLLFRRSSRLPLPQHLSLSLPLSLSTSVSACFLFLTFLIFLLSSSLLPFQCSPFVELHLCFNLSPPSCFQVETWSVREEFFCCAARSLRPKSVR